MSWLPAHGSCLQATGSWDSTIRMWDLRGGTGAIFHQELEGHRGNISCLCFSAFGLLVSWAAWVPGWLLAECKTEDLGLLWGPSTQAPNLWA